MLALKLTAILAALGAGAVGADAKKVPAEFTPTDMLSAPRPADPIVAPDGKLAISPVNQWDPKHDVTTRTIYLLDLEDTSKSSEPQVLFKSSPGQASEFIWLSNSTVAYLNGTSLYHFAPKPHKKHQDAATRILDFPAGTEPSALKFEPVSGTLAFSAAVWASNGDLELTGEGDEAWEKRGTTGIVFDDLFVRHWDTWRTPGRVYTIGTTTLRRKSNDEFVAEQRAFVNILKGTGLFSQMDAIGGDAFSLSPTHIAFALKPPHLNVAVHTRMDVFIQPLDQPGSRPLQLTPGSQGAVSALKFSRNGDKLAWLEMAKDGYESDRRVVVVHELADGGKIGSSSRWTDKWDRSPSDLEWDLDADSLFLIAENKGRTLLYHLATAGRLPTPLYFKHSVSSAVPLPDLRILLGMSSLTSPTEIYVLEPDMTITDSDEDDPDKRPSKVRRLTDYSGAHIDGRLDDQKGEDLWFKGVDDRHVHAWVVKPRGWSKNDKAKWPLAFFIHGGPQGAWDDSWSTRWNLALFASMGYFVVAVNPTGSTGYGQEFTDRIQKNWGSRPYQDLIAGYHAALDTYPEIDASRTAALGASYGGYMINWINGHNVFGFKALVYHDGILDTTDAFFSTEETWFPLQENGGTPWDHRSEFEKWNPLNFVQEWTTPQLVIQGGKDFRLPESQGTGTFTALQLQGVPSRFLYFPDENHWVLKPTNSQKWHHEVLRWLEEWVGRGEVDAVNAGAGNAVEEGVKAGEVHGDDDKVEVEGEAPASLLDEAAALAAAAAEAWRML